VHERSLLMVGDGFSGALLEGLERRGYRVHQVSTPEQVRDSAGAGAAVVLFEAEACEDPFVGLGTVQRSAPGAVVLACLGPEAEDEYGDDLAADGVFDFVAAPPELSELIFVLDAAVAQAGLRVEVPVPLDVGMTSSLPPSLPPPPAVVEDDDQDHHHALSQSQDLHELAEELEADRDRALAKLAEARKKLDAASLRIQELEGQVEVLKTRQAGGRMEGAELRTELEELKGKHAEIRRKARLMRETLTAKLEAAEAEAERWRQTGEEARAAADEQAVEAKLQALRAEREEVAEVLEEEKRLRSRAEEALDAERRVHRVKLEAAEAATTAARADAESEARGRAEAEDEVEGLRDSWDNLRETLRELQEASDATEADLKTRGEELAAAQRNLEDGEAERQRLAAALEEVRGELERTREELAHASHFEGELQATLRDVEEFRRRATSAGEELERLRFAQDGLTKQLEAVRAELDTERQAAAQLRDERGRTRAELRAVEAQLVELSSEADELREQTKSLQLQLREVRKETDELRWASRDLEESRERNLELERRLASFPSLKAEIDRLKAQLQGAREETEEVRRKAAEREAARSKRVEAAQDLEFGVEDLEEQLRDARHHCLRAKATMETTREEMEEYREEAERLRVDLQEATVRRAALEQEFDDLLARQEGRSVGEIQEELTRLLGQTEGYRHRVGELARELQGAHSRAEESAARAVRIEAGLRAAEAQRAEATERALQAQFQAEQAKRAAQEDRRAVGRLIRFQEELLDSLVAGVVMIDPRGHITLVNPAAAELLGVRSDDLVGKTYRDVPALRDIAPEIRRGLTGRSLKGGRFRLLLPEGSVPVSYGLVRLDVSGSRRCVLSLAPLTDAIEAPEA
jgi:chromosome segregation ATPase